MGLAFRSRTEHCQGRARRAPRRLVGTRLGIAIVIAAGATWMVLHMGAGGGTP
jgi:hypothetical protein